jgi:hypothetical protein
MKRLFLFVLTLCFFSNTSIHAVEFGYDADHFDHHHQNHHHHDHNGQHYLNFEVHRQDYTFSTVFDCLGEHDFLGTVVKSSFRVRTHYDLYNVKGHYEWVGICRALTLGAFYDWAREIDIYDHDGNYVGMIDGQMATDSKAKYSIYNGMGTRVGIAYLDHAGAAFTIVNPNKENHYIAYLQRHFVINAVDHWKVTVYDQNEIDLRIIKVFAAFALDSQNSFREDR